MANKNQVTLTFAGDTADLDKSFGKVTASADKMGEKIESTGEKTDRLATKAGTTSGAFGALQSGVDLTAVDLNTFSGKLMAAQLAFDAVSGAADLVTLALESERLAKLKDTAATIANTVATKTAAVASKVWAGAQWLLNAALDANPIGLIVVGIAALIAIIVVIATKTHWFQNIWRVAWSGIKTAAVAVWNFLKGLPAAIGHAFSNLGNIIMAPFKWAFNKISDIWNNTAGKLHFNFPSWVPGLGGKGFSMPQLPKFHQGGIVPGAPGTEVMALLQAGERVTSASSTGRTVTVSAGDALTAQVMQAIRDQVGLLYGGNVQIALGSAR